MKITANIATYKPRMLSLRHAVVSLYDQVDIIRICVNSHNDGDLDYFNNMPKVEIIIPEKDLIDNGKFYSLDHIKEPEYYFTCDDDLIYPPDYVQKTMEAIETYGIIVSYHGRILRGLNRCYYFDHKNFTCLTSVTGNHKIDVCGTGVTAFDTRYFHPKNLAFAKDQKMSDIVFSMEAAKQGKAIGVIEHKHLWLKLTPVELVETIHMTESATGNKRQNELANEIYTMNHGN